MIETITKPESVKIKENLTDSIMTIMAVNKKQEMVFTGSFKRFNREQLIDAITILEAKGFDVSATMKLSTQKFKIVVNKPSKER